MVYSKIFSYIKTIWNNGGWVYFFPLCIVGPTFFKKGYLFFVDFVWGPSMDSGWTNSWHGIEVVVTFLGQFISVAFLQKVFLLCILLGTVYVGRKLAKLFLENEHEASLIGLFVLMNPFVYGRMMMGQWGVLIAQMMLCIFFVQVYSFLENNNSKKLIWAGVSSGIVIFFTPQYIFLLCLIFIFTLLFQYRHIGKISFDGKFFTSSVIAILIAFSINISWVIPTYITQFEPVSHISIHDFSAFKPLGSTSVDVYTQLIAMDGFWAGNQGFHRSLQEEPSALIPSFLGILLVMLVGLFYLYTKKYYVRIILLIVFSTIVVVLASGVATPLGEMITTFMVDTVPVYLGMRDSGKWVGFLVILYAILFSFGLKYIFSIPVMKHFRHIVLVTVSIFICMLAPYSLFGFGKQIPIKKYPASWYSANTFLTQEGCRGATLVLPWHMYMSYDWLEYKTGTPARKFFNCPLITGTNIEWGGIYDSSGTEEGEIIPKWLETGNSTYLKALNVSHILLLKEVDWKEYEKKINTMPSIKLRSEFSDSIIYDVTQN